MYTDCGKCPYMGGCTNCDHPERHKAARAIDGIITFMNNRGDFRLVWNDLDEHQKKEIRLAWIDIVEQTP